MTVSDPKTPGEPATPAEPDATDTEVITPAEVAEPDRIVVIEPAPRKRRGGLIAALVIVGIVVVLAVVAVIGEALARQQAEAIIADEVRAALQLAPEHPVEVTIDGFSVLMQAIGGRLDAVTVEAEDVAFGELVGDLTLIVEGTPIDPTQRTDSVQAVYRVAEADVAALAGFLAGTVVNDVQLDDREIRFQTEFSFFGVEFSVGIGVTPTVEDGQLAFTPSSVVLDEERLDAADLLQQFGGLVEPLLTSQRFCVAQYLPQALDLTAVQVGDDQLVAVFQAADVALRGPGFSTLGTCE